MSETMVCRYILSFSIVTSKDTRLEKYSTSVDIIRAMYEARLVATVIIKLKLYKPLLDNLFLLNMRTNWLALYCIYVYMYS